jgi:SSS family solute:Na+ symporter
VGGRSFGTAATWAALSSTTIGGSTTLVLAALIAAKGLPAIWLDLAGAIGLATLGLLLASRVRETGALTISEVIGRLYGPRVRKIAASLTIAAEIVWVALLTQATETVVTAGTPWDSTRVLVATAALFVAYTALGGQRAVVGTDLFQFALMVAAILGVAFPLALRSLSVTGLPPDLVHFPVGPRFGWRDAAALLVLVGLPHLVGGDVWAKLLSAKSAAAARRAALFSAGSKLAFGAATATIALAGVAAAVPLDRPAALFPKTVLALAGQTLATGAVAPFLLVAMIATMQSSSDSVLLSASAATTHDLLPRASTPLWGRVFVVVYGGLGLLVALVLRDLVETFRLGYTLFASSLILPTLAGFLPGVRFASGMAAAAMLAGGAASLLQRWLHPGGADPVLVGTAVNALVLLLGARTPARAPGGEEAERP